MYSHRFVHFLAVWTNFLVLQTRLDQIQGEDAGDANNARNAAIDDLRQETEKDET